MQLTAMSTSFLPVMTMTGSCGWSLRISSSSLVPGRWGMVRSSTITPTSVEASSGRTWRLSLSVRTVGMPAERRVRLAERSSPASSSTRSTTPPPANGRSGISVVEGIDPGSRFRNVIRLLRGGRQRDGGGRPLADLGFERERPLVLLDDRLGDGKPEPQPAGFELGGKKRLRQAGHRARVHSLPLVLHADLHAARCPVPQGAHLDA